MFEEYQAIEKAGMWIVPDFTELPSGRKPVCSRWVFKVKYNADRLVKHLKVELLQRATPNKKASTPIRHSHQ